MFELAQLWHDDAAGANTETVDTLGADGVSLKTAVAFLQSLLSNIRRRMVMSDQVKHELVLKAIRTQKQGWGKRPRRKWHAAHCRFQTHLSHIRGRRHWRNVSFQMLPSRRSAMLEDLEIRQSRQVAQGFLPPLGMAAPLAVRSGLQAVDAERKQKPARRLGLTTIEAEQRAREIARAK